MSTQTKFFFNAKDNTSQAFNNITKSLKKITVATVAFTTAMKALSAVVKGVTSALTKVLSSALKGIVSLVKGALNAIKSLVTACFKFIKSALSTLLSWIKKALGKVFDWVTSTIKNILTGITNMGKSAVNVAKKAIDTIVDGIKAYADKEYNEIQLRVSLGDSFDTVMKSFKNLLRYTTEDKNELLSIFATYAEVGKKPEEIEKFAKATVYLSNATGRSLSQITRLLLGQEAAGSDLERVLHKIGVNISEQETSLTNVEKIIAQMGDEMEAISESSLAQAFANVKNDVITIKEQLGYIFSGPVRYVAQKIDDLLKRLIGTNKITEWADKVDAVFNNIKPTLDKIFEFFGKFIKDPEGFFRALWADISGIFTNIWNNIGTYLELIGQTIGLSVTYIWDYIKSTDFSGFQETMDFLGKALNNFIIGIGKGLNFWDDTEIVEGNLKQTFINAWNNAHPDFELSEDDKWYQTLGKLTNGILEDIDSRFVNWWNGLDWDISKKIVLNEEDAWYKNLLNLLQGLWSEWFKPSILDPLVDWWSEHWPNVRDTIITTLQYAGTVLGIALNNAIASSDVIRTVLNILPGVNFGNAQTLAEAQNAIYSSNEAVFKAKGINPEDITSEFLNSTYGWVQNGKNGYIASWAQYLNKNSGYDLSDEIKAINATILEVKDYPSFDEYINRVSGIWNPVEEAMEETTAAMEETAEVVEEAAEVTEEMLRILNERMQAIEGSRPNMNFPYALGTGTFLDGIPHFSEGGKVDGPTVALVGEDGPEYIVPTEDVTDNSSNQKKTLWDLISELWSSAPSIMGNVTGLTDWWNSTVIPSLEKEDEKVAKDTTIPWYKKLWDGVKKVATNIGKYFKENTLSLIGNSGALGTHMGNILSGIQTDINNKDFSIWTAIGRVLQELLPYLQKGLEVIGHIFDEAFEIFGNAVQILGERIGKVLLPLLEAFIPFMKTLADIVIALSPVLESMIKPAILVIAAVLNILTGVLDKLMPVFAGLASVIQWVSDAITWAIGSAINWLASWIPWISSVNVSKPKRVGDYYNDIMGSYEASKANSVTGISMTSSTGTASQTASYSGSNHIYITNEFGGSYIVGSGGMRELALIIRNTLEDLDYTGQTI